MAQRASLTGEGAQEITRVSGWRIGSTAAITRCQGIWFWMRLAMQVPTVANAERNAGREHFNTS